MTHTSLEIRTLERADEMSAVVTMFQQVWGSVTPLVGVEVLRAIAHSGGYVAGAFEHGNIIGASFGFLARHHGTPALHSHVTGILPGVQHGGVGRAMKNHQRTWAAEEGLEWVTWTFDPLVRRNAWFNIEVLRARVAEYLVDFYGPMSDTVNRQDETDRLLMAWPVSNDGRSPGTAATPATAATDGGEPVEVDTPEDIVKLRRTDPGAAAEWRLRVRAELGDRLATGGEVTGFTREGSYLVVGGER
jgi:predicted GNAT superfamily acetyltransferase